MKTTRNYVYMLISMDKEDYMLDQLIDDLLDWTRHINYLHEDHETVVYGGLVPFKEADHLQTLQAASPYGAGYSIRADLSKYYNQETYKYVHMRALV